jgi:hypothetical protein
MSSRNAASRLSRSALGVVVLAYATHLLADRPVVPRSTSDYPQTMLAYLDPGAGSLILQALAGGVAGLVVFGKIYWGRFKRILRFGRDDSSSDEPAR